MAEQLEFGAVKVACVSGVSKKVTRQQLTWLSRLNFAGTWRTFTQSDVYKSIIESQCQAQLLWDQQNMKQMEAPVHGALAHPQGPAQSMIAIAFLQLYLVRSREVERQMGQKKAD
jgi:hypothetical protein